MRPLRIGTRSSKLALWQAEYTRERLRSCLGAREVELVLIETKGDQVRDRPLSQIGGDGLFTKEIQNAVLEDRADVAVHSLKDLPTTPIAELTLAAVPPRGPTGDAFVSRLHKSFALLPVGARVGTSSLRRRSQLLHVRGDLAVEVLRGNVETRLRKLEDENMDAIILAEAGLVRLGLSGHIVEILDRRWMLPAVGQGALGLECRTGDAETRRLLAALDDPIVHACVTAERAFLRALGGGCIVPIGALAREDAGMVRLEGAVLAGDGSKRVGGSESGGMGNATEVGERLAERLLEEGARDLLARER